MVLEKKSKPPTAECLEAWSSPWSGTGLLRAFVAFALPVVRYLLFIFSWPELPCASAPALLVAEAQFPSGPAALGLHRSFQQLFSSEWFSGKGGREKSIQALCFKVI